MALLLNERCPTLDDGVYVPMRLPSVMMTADASTKDATTPSRSMRIPIRHPLHFSFSIEYREGERDLRVLQLQALHQSQAECAIKLPLPNYMEFHGMAIVTRADHAIHQRSELVCIGHDGRDYIYRRVPYHVHEWRFVLTEVRK